MCYVVVFVMGMKCVLMVNCVCDGGVIGDCYVEVLVRCVLTRWL